MSVGRCEFLCAFGVWKKVWDHMEVKLQGSVQCQVFYAYSGNQTLYCTEYTQKHKAISSAP